MLITKKLDKVTQSKIYKDWKQKNKEAYLAHLFVSSENLDEFNFGFYLPKKDQMKVFVANGEIKENPDEGIFKKPDAVIETLDITKVKLDVGKALEIAKERILKHHKNPGIVKYFVILQTLKKPIYNMSHITREMNIINFHFDAISGKLINEKTIPLTAFKQK